MSLMISIAQQCIMSVTAVLLLLSLFSSLTVATDYTCPPVSSARPSNVQVTSTDESCGYHLSMGPNENNNSYVDIYLEGKEKGWVAVGFSHNSLMAYTDVVGCKRDSSGQVGVVNTWNGALPPNKIDPTQDGMCNYASKYDNGTFSCLFSRYAGIINEGYDYNLNDKYYLLLGCSVYESDITANFPFHWPHHPKATDTQYNPYVKT